MNWHTYPIKDLNCTNCYDCRHHKWYFLSKVWLIFPLFSRCDHTVYICFLGVTLLLTNMERASLDERYHDVLLRQFTVTADGTATVKIGTESVCCHRNFFLYLSTSVPLYFKGFLNFFLKLFFSFPISKFVTPIQLELQFVHMIKEY